MSPNMINLNAVAAIRVSTEKQGRDGDSPEAQKEQIDRWAQARGITIKQYFTFLESASKDQQPVQPAIDYCKSKKNNVQLFIIKSIDRFTRGGSDVYSPLKSQLEQCNVKLVDIYGVISAEEVNTLDHLGFEYKWSKYSPSKKSEILEAERAKDELRDIMSRMIGAEIRYTKLGYWMRQPPYGFISEKIETKHGKRCILKPHPTEGKYIKMMYELRARGDLLDEEIVKRVNDLGCRTRVRYVRDRQDRTKIISRAGGKPMTVKAMQKYLSNPIYAGVIKERWTNDIAVATAFNGLVDFDTFNRGNQNKKILVKDDEGNISLHTKKPPEHLINKGKRNADFAYRKYVLCPTCRNPLSGSASRGKSGKYYPAYHCSNHGHYYRIPKQELENQVIEFIQHLMIPQDNIQTILDVISAEWNIRNQSQLQELEDIDTRIKELRDDAVKTMDRIRAVTSATAIKFLEEDILRIDQQIEELEAQRTKKSEQMPADFERIITRVKYFLEHLDELLVRQIDPIKKAKLFAAIFMQPPTYDDLKIGTQKTPLFTGVNQIFALAKMEKSLMVTSWRIELQLPG